MGRFKTKSDYEELRKARILENQARLATLGLQKTLPELRSLNSSPKSEKPHSRNYCKVDRSATPLRRSSRLTGISPPSEGDAKSDYEELRKARILENQARLATLGLQETLSELRSLNSLPKSEKIHKRKYCKVDRSATPLRRSARLTGKSPPSESGNLSYSEGSNGGEIGGAKRRLRLSKISEEDLRRRCESKARGSLYDPVYGICCHFCRQKKLCGEEDCKRCGDQDMDQPCIGKTDCSVCHSSNGILCRACLKVRYGEEMEEVRMNKEWMCPHCIEEKGSIPYWICNSSFCMKKRKMVPTGIAIYRAREMGYKSVAHLLMDELSKRR
ncbi:uncharacterized protein LOC130987951 [Salvia miltiorrhiza]|uniref:uncharacterized protein LOC130987951 n=1 Tax=Salvia miltiorrhiza TaxID=226208 RepID=UPI0025AD2C9E|nr:uncharacterized protein LOC130987951 [Salvia miltiorrhiza]